MHNEEMMQSRHSQDTFALGRVKTFISKIKLTDIPKTHYARWSNNQLVVRLNVKTNCSNHHISHKRFTAIISKVEMLLTKVSCKCVTCRKYRNRGLCKKCNFCKGWNCNVCRTVIKEADGSILCGGCCGSYRCQGVMIACYGCGDNICKDCAMKCYKQDCNMKYCDGCSAEIKAGTRECRNDH